MREKLEGLKKKAWKNHVLVSFSSKSSTWKIISNMLSFILWCFDVISTLIVCVYMVVNFDERLMYVSKLEMVSKLYFWFLENQSCHSRVSLPLIGDLELF